MILVVDTNRIIAALIKDSLSRKIFFHEKFLLVTIQHSKNEVKKHKEEILRKGKIDEESLDQLMTLLFKRTVHIQDEILEQHMKEAKEIMDTIDPDDTPFIAGSLATGAALWSDDAHFEKQNAVKVWKTKDILKYL